MKRSRINATYLLMEMQLPARLLRRYARILLGTGIGQVFYAGWLNTLSLRSEMGYVLTFAFSLPHTHSSLVPNTLLSGIFNLRKMQLHVPPSLILPDDVL